MTDGSHYMKINDTFCCRFNISLRRSPYSGSHPSSGLAVHNDAAAHDSGGMDKRNGASIGEDKSTYHHGDSKSCVSSVYEDVLYLSSNITWDDIRRITSTFQGDVTLYCDVNSTVQANSFSNASIVSRADYLAYTLGPRHISTAALVVLSVLYIIIFLTGVLGNLCTCVVIIRNRCLHTATNYYLFSLAISDVLTLLLALPEELTRIWEAYPFIFGSGFCYIKSFVSEVTSYASVLTITAFTIDRYMAICHPLQSQALSSLYRAVRIIIIIWIIACACAMPYPIHTRMYYEVVDPCTGEPLPDSLLCNLPPQWRNRMTYVFQFSTFAFFVVPMIIITIMYALIGLTLMKTDQFASGKKNKQAAIAAAKSKRAVLKMLVAVVIAFFLCWAPFHSQRLMTLYVPHDAWTDTMLTLQTCLFYVSGVLYFFSSTVNPILYNVMSKRYRKAFKLTLYRCVRGNNYEYRWERARQAYTGQRPKAQRSPCTATTDCSPRTGLRPETMTLK
uniref:Neuromedin U receptor variant b n=1 Tax=Deroceras reticulatum TaxID=145610 RepID=A0A888YNJ5_DERRE|nr:neuromedin U receptor variant b [Deroceras reticulatum]